MVSQVAKGGNTLQNKISLSPIDKSEADKSFLDTIFALIFREMWGFETSRSLAAYQYSERMSPQTVAELPKSETRSLELKVAF